MGRKKKGTPEETVDKAVGRVAEATGSLTGDKTMKAEGAVLGRAALRRTYRVVAQPSGGWRVESDEEVLQVTGIHRTKDEAVGSATDQARAHEPSQLLVYKKDGTVQMERLYG